MREYKRKLVEKTTRIGGKSILRVYRLLFVFFFCSFSFFHFFSPFPRTTTDMQLHGKLKNVMEPRTIDLLFLVKYLYLIFRWIQRQGIGVPCRENDRLYTMKRQNIMQ